MPRAEVTLPGSTSSVPTARHFVESVLTSWGQPDAAWSAALCVSELAANCALHARTEFTVQVELTGEAVRIEVRDGSPRLPAQRSYDSGSTTGRGLRMVGDYSRSWGVEATVTGKTVWVLLDLAPAGSSRGDGEDVDAEVLLATFGGEDEGAGTRVELLWQVAA